MFKTVTEITATQFEKEVKSYLESAAGQLAEFRTEHRESIEGHDGTYEIDVTVRFRALGSDFLVLVECKHHRSPVKREHVQVLRDKLIAVGAQKAMLFSTSDFQDGAVQYALEHGIALIRVAPGETSYSTRALNSVPLPITIPAYVGWLIEKQEQDGARKAVSYSLVGHQYPEALKKFLLCRTLSARPRLPAW